jgi:lipopolysaccharide export system protein LptC
VIEPIDPPEKISHAPPLERTGYDWYVSIMKWALPMISLALLLTILIWPLTNSREFSFLLSKTQLASSTERLRLEQPVYNGVDGRNRPFTIQAESAVQRTSKSPNVELRGIAARIQLEEGTASVTATAGRYDMESQLLRISGMIEVMGPRNYRLTTPGARVDLNTRQVAGADIKGTGPLGRFEARRFRTDLSSGIVVFDGGARLHIVPKKKG